MQYLARPAKAPAILTSAEAKKSRRAMRAYMNMDRAKRSQTSVPKIGLDAANPELVRELSAMSQGKCAFCERRVPLLAHRFRPPGNAEPTTNRSDPHLFYVWLADAWQNLLPICAECRPERPLFPVIGDRCRLPSPNEIDAYLSRNDGTWKSRISESTELINPSVETAYDSHYRPKLDGGLRPLNSRFLKTVECFRLDRPDLTKARASAYSMYLDRLRTAVSDRRTVATRDSTSPSYEDLFEFAKLEFGGSWSLLLKRIASRIESSNVGPASKRRPRLKHFFDRLTEAPDGMFLLNHAVTQIELEDAGAKPPADQAETCALGPPELAKLRRIAVSNYKSVERLELDIPAPPPADETGRRTAPALIILGENATGKSSLLEAVALTLADEQARRGAVVWHEIPLDPEQLGDETGGSLRDARVDLTFDDGATATLTVAADGSETLPEPADGRPPVFAYGAFRRFADEPGRSETASNIHNLFNTSPLPHPESWLKRLPTAQRNLVIRALRDLLSIEGEFDVIEAVGRPPQLRMVTAIAAADGTLRKQRTPLATVSSGYRAMLGMTCDILRGLIDLAPDKSLSSFEHSEAVVLIDEIEAHLHPRWKVQVMSSLRKALPGVTFIVTTHDPLCLRGMAKDEVVVLQRVSSDQAGVESDLPTAVERIIDLPDPASLRLEQLLTSDFFQLFSTSDAASDRRLARIGELLRKDRAQELSQEDEIVLDDLRRDIANALPVGSSAVHQMVQDAVATYLEERRQASAEALGELSVATKAKIVAALERL